MGRCIISDKLQNALDNLFISVSPLRCIYWCLPDVTPEPVRLALFLNTIKYPTMCSRIFRNYTH